MPTPGVRGPRLSIRGDARSNYSDLEVLLSPPRRICLVAQPGDAAARPYGAIAPMVGCRNLGQLEEFVDDVAR